MTNYSQDESQVRVDFFKPSGKWKYTFSMKWTGGFARETEIHDAFEDSIIDNFGNSMDHLDAVCLEPYHEMAHPLQRKAKTEAK